MVRERNFQKPTDKSEHKTISKARSSTHAVSRVTTGAALSLPALPSRGSFFFTTSSPRRGEEGCVVVSTCEAVWLWPCPWPWEWEPTALSACDECRWVASWTEVDFSGTERAFSVGWFDHFLPST